MREEQCASETPNKTRAVRGTYQAWQTRPMPARPCRTVWDRGETTRARQDGVQRRAAARADPRTVRHGEDDLVDELELLEVVRSQLAQVDAHPGRGGGGTRVSGRLAEEAG